MANTFFVDYQGGNDSSDGLSFANRKKTLTGLSAGELNPGDEIRFMTSLGYSQMNVAATWTQRSPYVTLNTAVNLLLDDGNTAWTASASVTTARDTSIYRTTGNSAQIAIADGFTTGLAAYIALGSAQDCSGYNGLTFWFRSSINLPANTLSLRLCSDTAGVTTVDTIPIPPLNVSALWMPIYVDKGSALGASIQSVALYADADPGTMTVWLDNINTVKPASSNDNLTLTSIIAREQTVSTNNEGWFCLNAIDGTVLTLGFNPRQTASLVHRGYPSNTASSSTIYKVNPTQTIDNLKANDFSGVTQTLNDNGNTTHYLTLSGGWNTTDMTTQVGETWFDGMTGWGNGIYLSNQYISFDKLHTCRYTTGTDFRCSDSIVGNAYSTGCHSKGINLYGITRLNVNCFMVTSCAQESFAGTGMGMYHTDTNSATFSQLKKIIAYCCGAETTLFNAGFTFDSSPSSKFKITELVVKNSVYNNIVMDYGPVYCIIENIVTEWAGNMGLRPNGGISYPWRDSRVGTITARYNYYNISCADNAIGPSLTIDDIAAVNSTGFGMGFEFSYGRGTIIVKKINVSNNFYGIYAWYPEGKKYFLSSDFTGASTPFTVFGSALGQGEIIFKNYNGTAGNNRTYFSGLGTVYSNTSVRHTASGYSWQFSPTENTRITAEFPLKKKIGAIACAANQTVTANLWVYRTDTGLVSKLVVPGGQLGGVTSNVVNLATGAASTWDQLSVQFTPTESGVAEVWFECYGGTTYSVNIDDFSVTQG